MIEDIYDNILNIAYSLPPSSERRKSLLNISKAFENGEINEKYNIVYLYDKIMHILNSIEYRDNTGI